MASIGHIAVGMAAGKFFTTRVEPTARPWRTMAVLSALSMVPDLDVIGFFVGVEYEDPFGHRGATHSILFAVITGVIGALVAKKLAFRPVPLALVTGLVMLSHPILDMFTNGGLGCALFFPSNERYFFPVTPIPVAPIGLAFLSKTGVLVMVVEAVLFAPLFLYATWPRKQAAKPAA